MMTKPPHLVGTSSNASHNSLDKAMAELHPDFLNILCCPISKKPLVLFGDWLVSTDEETRLRYPINNGIPSLLAESGEEMDLASWNSALKKSD